MSDSAVPVLPRGPWDLDGRVKLLLLLFSCFVCQYLPAVWLPVWLVVLGCLFIPGRRRGRNFSFMLRGGVVFILFWLLMTAGSDLVGGKGLWETVLSALPLGGRLLGLTLVGMAYVEYSSAVETGRAAAWFLRPVFGGYAWKPALGIALTAWFLPRTLSLSSDIRSSMRARGLRLSWYRRVILLIGTALRILEGKSVALATALASRRTDDARSWR